MYILLVGNDKNHFDFWSSISFFWSDLEDFWPLESFIAVVRHLKLRVPTVPHSIETVCDTGSYTTFVSHSTVSIAVGFVQPISNGIGTPFILV
jgi:hypothetical protein